MAAEYTITHDKGTTFKFHALYKSATGGAIDLAGQSARMQVRRSPDDTQLALFITGSGVTSGGSTGEFAVGAGVGGTGGITLNGSNSGAAGTTGMASMSSLMQFHHPIFRLAECSMTLNL